MRVGGLSGRLVPIFASEIPVAGVVIDVVTDVAGTMIVLTGLIAAGLRAGAVLSKSSPERVELQTAFGFIWGITTTMVFLALDAVIR